MKRCASLFVLTFAACLSSAPPAPPVRWFDPSSTTAADPASSEPVERVAVRLVAGPHLRSELALRVAAHELVFDDRHRWLMPPVDLLGGALARVGVRDERAADAAVVRLEAFELARGEAPVARVRLTLARAGRSEGVVQVVVPADGDSVEALVRAMAEALPRAAAEARAWLVAP